MEWIPSTISVFFFNFRRYYTKHTKNRKKNKNKNRSILQQLSLTNTINNKTDAFLSYMYVKYVWKFGGCCITCIIIHIMKLINLSFNRQK